MITVEKGKGGVEGGKQKNEKGTNAENNRLKKNKDGTTLFPPWFQIAAILRPHEQREPVYVCMRPLTSKQTALSWI